MSWTNELYQIYELNCGNESSDDKILFPVFHTKANAQIEIMLDVNGNFKGASTVNKKDAETIIPDTGKAKTGKNPPPYPLAESIKYIAGDLSKFAPKEIKENKKFFDAYVSQLKEWKESEYSHPAIDAVYNYIIRASVVSDLIRSNVLRTDSETGFLPIKQKELKIETEKAFVRFIILYDDLSLETRTWKDKSLYNSFISFNQKNATNTQLCYALGKDLPPMEIHPYQIVNSNPRAKLISSNDDKGFTFRGRFANKSEALSVSYEFSQKMHNALKWLIQKQGQAFGSLTLLIWASALQPLPNELNKEKCIEDDWYDDDETEIPDTLPLYKIWLSRYLTGYRQKFEDDTKIMIMGLDAATTGRLSISLYDELQGLEFLNHLENWHENSAWRRFDGKHNLIKSFSLYEIIKSAYGTEQSGKLECDEKIIRDQILRLLPCVMNGRRIPEDLIQSLYHKASNPLAYEDKKTHNHRLVLETACGMIRIFTIRNQKGDVTMGFDPNETNRSYLYGCLLAIADKTESDTYEEADKSKRITNARRYWSRFAQSPYQTWGIIEEKLQPYLNQHPYKNQVQKDMQMIMDKLTPEAFSDNSRLENLYLLGYHHFTAYLYLSKEEKEKLYGNVTA